MDSIGEITLTMRNETVAAIAGGEQISRAGIAEVVEARQRGLAAIQEVDPPPDFSPEHAVLLRVLAELATASEMFMASTTHLNPSQFEQAVLAAFELDKIVARVGTACIAVERRAENLVTAVDLSC